MKTLGLIGGLSWFSTSVYYRTINQLVNQRLGSSHSAKLFLYSVNFEEFKIIQEKNDWGELEHMITTIARKLESVGADCIVMCTNTPHLIADQVRMQINIPLIHIAEVTAREIQMQNIKKIGILGTKFTMENSFFRDRLAAFGIDSLIPDDNEREFIHASIFNELTKGIFREETKLMYLEIMDNLRNNGCNGVIFGCTEISLLLTQADSSLMIFDTTAIHSKAAVDFALS